LYKDINDFKKGYQPRTNVIRIRRVIWLQTPTVFWLGGGIISFSYSVYTGLMMLGRLKYIQQSHWCLSPVSLDVEMAIEKLKRHNHQVLIKFQQN
jgi:hypothetical protein